MGSRVLAFSSNVRVFSFFLHLAFEHPKYLKEKLTTLKNNFFKI